MPGMAVCLLISFATRSVEAWLSTGSNFIGNKSDGKVNYHRQYLYLPINSNINIHYDIMIKKTRRGRGMQSTKTSTQLAFIKWKDTTDEDTEPNIQLTSEQDQILRDVTTKMEESYGIGWFEQSDAWDELKEEYPALQEYTNDELTKAFILQKPTFIEVFTKTPLGPILLVNAIFKLGGFSWCDTPFGSADACL